MDNDTFHQVITMIQRRIEESRINENAIRATSEGRDIRLQLEQEYGKRRALLDLWEEINNNL